MKKKSYSGLCKLIPGIIALLVLAIASFAQSQQYSDDQLNDPNFDWNQVDVNQLTPAQFDQYYDKIPPAKLDEYFRNPDSINTNPAAADKYFADPNNLFKNPATTAAYFSKPENINKNLANAQQYLQAQTGSERGGRAQLTIIQGVSYNPDTKQLSNGATTITLSQFGRNDVVEALQGGGFKINGVIFNGGNIDKKNTEYTVTFGTSTVNFNLLPGQGTGGVVLNNNGFEFSGTASDVKVTINGVSVNFDSTKGNVRILNDGTIVGENAHVFIPSNGRYYSGNFQTKGDETILLPKTDGTQSTFYDSKNVLGLKVITNGGNVQIHSNQLPADAANKQNPEQPLTLEEAKARAEQATPITANNGEVWYKGRTVVAKGFVGVSGKEGLESFNYFGNGKESDFYRSYDPNNPSSIITTAKGTFKLDLSNRISADSTIYKGNNPEQIMFSVYTAKKADAVTIDTPNDGIDALKVTRYLHKYESISATGGRVVTDLGNEKFEVIASKSNNELNLKMTEQTLSFLGKVRENPSIFVTMNGAKDFLLNDKSGNVYFGLTAEGGLLEKTAGGYVSLLGPGSVMSALGKDTILIKPEQAKTVASVLQKVSSTNAQELASLQLSPEDLKTLETIMRGNPTMTMLVQCIAGDAACKNRDNFLQKYADYNLAIKELDEAQKSKDQNKINNANVNAAQKFFDLTIASGAKPDVVLSANLAEIYLSQGKMEKALEISRQVGNVDLSRYVAARYRMSNLGTGEGAVDNIAESISSLGQIKPDSPLYEQASKVKAVLVKQMLSIIGQTANTQSQAAIEKYQSSYTFTAALETAFANSYLLGGARANIADYVIDDLSTQALGTMVLGKLVEKGYSINQIKSMDSAQRQKMLQEVFPNANSNSIGIFSSGIGSALQNPDVQVLAALENGVPVKNVQQPMPQGKIATAFGTTPPNVVFPGVQGGAAYNPDANMLDLTVAEKLWGMIPQVALAPVLAEAGATALGQIGAKIAPLLSESQKYAKLAAIGTDIASELPATVKTFGTLGAEFGGSYVAQLGLEAVGVPTPVAMALSNLVSLNPATSLKTATGFVKELEATKRNCYYL